MFRCYIFPTCSSGPESRKSVPKWKKEENSKSQQWLQLKVSFHNAKKSSSVNVCLTHLTTLLLVKYCFLSVVCKIAAFFYLLSIGYKGMNFGFRDRWWRGKCWERKGREMLLCCILFLVILSIWLSQACLKGEKDKSRTKPWSEFSLYLFFFFLNI